jgi:hypothetical protein
MSIYNNSEELSNQVNECIIDFLSETVLTSHYGYQFMSESNADTAKKTIWEKVRAFFVKMGGILKNAIRSVVNKIKGNKTKLSNISADDKFADTTPKKEIISYNKIFKQARGLAQFSTKAQSNEFDENDQAHITNSISELKNNLRDDKEVIGNRNKKEIVTDLHNHSTVLVSLSQKVLDLFSSKEKNNHTEESLKTASMISQISSILVTLSLQFTVAAESVFRM